MVTDSKKERMMHIRHAENALRRISHSQISVDDSELLDIVHMLLWRIYKRMEEED